MQTLDNGNMWGIAIENAVGGLLNAFIVTDHKDSLQLRACAKQANYNHLRIIIYDFSRPRLWTDWMHYFKIQILHLPPSSDLLEEYSLFVQVEYPKSHASTNQTSNCNFCFTFWQRCCGQCIDWSGNFLMIISCNSISQ